MNSHLFVITGSPGAGKTPVIDELAAKGFTCVAEPARAILAQQRAINGSGVPDRDPALFCALMLTRAEADFARARTSSSPVFFDRAIPDLVAYAELFDLDKDAALRSARAHRYADTAFFAPSWPEIYRTDSERKMTFEMADAFGARIKEVYADLGYTLVDVPHDTQAARADFILTTTGLVRR